MAAASPSVGLLCRPLPLVLLLCRLVVALLRVGHCRVQALPDRRSHAKWVLHLWRDRDFMYGSKLCAVRCVEVGVLLSLA